MQEEEAESGAGEAERPPGRVLIRATSEQLIMHLMEEHSVVDPTYVEDFLLTYRTFLTSPMFLGKKLLQWFNDLSLRDKVIQVVLLWINNHFSDFEEDPALIHFLEEFEHNLEREKMNGQLRLLNVACAAKAKVRLVTITRPSTDAPASFTLLGGSEKAFGIFIDGVQAGSKASEAGLKRGDQVLEVNGQNFENIPLSKATEILKSNIHLDISVKTNLLVFKELLSQLAEEKKDDAIPKVEVGQVMNQDKVNKKTKANTVGRRNKLSKILDKTGISILPQKLHSDIEKGQSQDDRIVGMEQSKPGPAFVPVSGTPSSSSPDLLNSHHSIPDFNNPPSLPSRVLRVFIAHQQSCYVTVSQKTTAKEVVAQAVREFNLPGAATAYSLCEVSVSPDGVIMQRQLPDRLSKLADRVPVTGRYHLKNNMKPEMLCSEEDARDLLREGRTSMLQFSAADVATQLTRRSFELFRDIEPAEYIDDLFELRSKTGSENLKRFEELINHETFWVASEILSEPNQCKRMKIIRNFIEIALQCRKCKNFSSMFAIISGLNLAPVSRLQGTWKKLPRKYKKLFHDLEDLFDPSRNMGKYRNALNDQDLQPPIIPLFPIIKKDLTFFHEGNDSKVDGLVNFEKLRNIADEVRRVRQMASEDPAVVFRRSQGGSNAGMPDMVQTAGHKKRGRHTSFLSAKKLYEDSQMSRRIQHYLSNLTLDTCEDSLHAMSLQREPLTKSAQAPDHGRPAARTDPRPAAVQEALNEVVCCLTPCWLKEP